MWLSTAIVSVSGQRQATRLSHRGKPAWRQYPRSAFPPSRLMARRIRSSPVVLRTTPRCSLTVTSIVLWTAATICHGKRPMILLMRSSLFEGGQLKLEKGLGYTDNEPHEHISDVLFRQSRGCLSAKPVRERDPPRGDFSFKGKNWRLGCAGRSVLASMRAGAYCLFISMSELFAVLAASPAKPTVRPA